MPSCEACFDAEAYKTCGIQPSPHLGQSEFFKHHGFRGWVLRYSDVSGRLVEFSDECLYERTSQ
jgi:hypothetical protein